MSDRDGDRIKHNLEHDVRKFVDRWRENSELDDRDIALVLDAVRAELEIGNYQEAHGNGE